MSGTSDPLTHAHLALVGLTLLLWVIAWSLRYVPLPIKDPLVRRIVQLIYGGGVGAFFIIEPMLYRTMTGNNGNLLKNDHFLSVIVMTQAVGSTCIALIALLVRRWKS
jgi:hypothetical protein